MSTDEKPESMYPRPVASTSDVRLPASSAGLDFEKLSPAEWLREHSPDGVPRIRHLLSPESAVALDEEDANHRWSAEMKEQQRAFRAELEKRFAEAAATKLRLGGRIIELEAENARLRGALQEGLECLEAAVRHNVDIPGFDVGEHVTVKRMRAALSPVPEASHFGTSVAHGGLEKHRGDKDACSAPDCGPEPEANACANPYHAKSGCVGREAECYAANPPPSWNSAVDERDALAKRLEEAVDVACKAVSDLNESRWRGDNSDMDAAEDAIRAAFLAQDKAGGT